MENIEEVNEVVKKVKEVKNVDKNIDHEFVSLDDSQKAVIINYNRQEFDLRIRYLDSARKLGELKDQLSLAESTERQLRTQLNQLEAQKGNELKRFATELGWTEKNQWTYLFDSFGFRIEF